MTSDEIDALRAEKIRYWLRDLNDSPERAMPRLLADLRAIDQIAERERAAARPAPEPETAPAPQPPRTASRRRAAGKD